jgi:hypothetical protein
MSPRASAVANLRPPVPSLPPSLYLSATTLAASAYMKSAPLLCLAVALFGRALHVAMPRGPLKRTRRESALGSFATTGEGETHYRVYGPESGPLVLLIHGFASSTRSFDPLAVYLSSKFGARVIVCTT